MNIMYEKIKNNFNINSVFNFFVLLLASTFFFERIPSIESPLGPIRMYNIVIPLIFGLLILLILSKKIDLKSYSIPYESLVLILFLVLSTLGFKFVINDNRFLAAYLSLIFCACSCILLSIFKIEPIKILRLFVILFIGQFVFSAYQFIGDKYLLLPPELTGIKPLFQSNVFGIPRVHNTYNEPAYYANALFLAIFLFLFLSFSKVNVFGKYIKYYKTTYFVLFLVSVLIFILTLAKSAWLILPLPLLVAIFGLFVSINNRLIKTLFLGTLVLVCLGFGLSTRLAPGVVNNISSQFIDTAEGNSATSIERTAYSNAALELIPQYLFTGIGPGQFGTYAKSIILNNLYPGDVPVSNGYFVTKPNVNYLNVIETEKNIVFNVYLEVLLEYGLLAFVSYILFLLLTITKTLKKLYSNALELDETNVLRLALLFYIICSLGQFVFISPVYINPFFVAVGLLISLNNNYAKSNI
jgi:O-antigen ligase